MVSPKISVVTPSYNQASYLKRTILSVLNQDVGNVEYIIMDGGSTDGSVGVIKEYETDITYWESTPDKGQSHAINKGWERATGDIIAWINSDDYYLPSAFKKVADAYQKRPDAIAFIGICVLVDGDGENIGKEIKPITFDFESILKGGDIPGQPAVFLSRQLLDSIGYLNDDMHYIMDWEYWLRVAMNYSPNQCVLINEPLAAFNTWEGGKTQKGIGKDLKDKRVFFSNFYSKEEKKIYKKYKRYSFGSTYWAQGRRYLENKMFLKAIIAYVRAFLFHPFEFNFFKALYKNMDLILPVSFQKTLKKTLKIQPKSKI